MSAPSPTAERREAMLGELAEWLHAAADKTRRMLMASEEVDEVVRLNASLTKVARGERQCVMLHDRLEAGRLKAETAAAEQQADAEAEAHVMAVSRRKSRIGRAISRRLEQDWPEPEDLDDDDNEAFNARLEDLNERLDDLSETEAFLSQDPDTLIAQLCEEFGVPPPPPPLIPGPPTPAKAGEAGTQAESAPPPHGSPPSRGRAEGIHAPNTS